MSGTLRLGAIATLGPYFLPHLLSPLRKMHPKLNLLLTEGLTDGLLKQLREGELDAVLASPTFAPEGFRVVPLFFEPFLLAAPPKHALSEKDTLRATDLKTEEMVLLEDGHCLKDQAVEFCPANRRGSYRRYHATSLETLRHLVAAGHGYTLFPALAVEMAHNSLKNLVIYRPFTGKAVGRPIVLVCREKYARMAQIDELAQLIQKNLPPGVWAHAV